ncbi:bifunctional DNA-formamidopyrimidine glycosylase/DNA-(apurinic or apyrimidinic site) lyase [Streptomyces sp. NPDC050704]|uniref:bifunctional DNA-formamidopyrimidine glycosylase/DNA-(apurinic or apyrimidinic site) lyase n=1 Tax=Streptomyces sp. NPDC050704 TaxID=3157219 RepID=UPI00341A450B
MPELPEVEVVRRGLERWVSGRIVADVQVLHPRAVRRHIAGGEDFGARLKGHRIGLAQRRGKYLWLPLSDLGEAGHVPAPPGTAPRPVVAAPEYVQYEGAAPSHDAPHGPTRERTPLRRGRSADSPSAVLAHLGMSGQLLVQPQDAPDEKHLRIRVRFSDALNTELRFVDQRTFGGLSLHEMSPDGLPDVIAHIARDPLDPLFDDDAFHEALRRRRTTVKRALLDQSLISGVGNIYADEALWRARLHYERPTTGFTRPRTAELLGHVRDVMNAALAVGGTSFDSLYVNVNGESGYFDRSLDAYGREGEPCRRCGTLMRRRPWMNRSSYFCPRCQRPPRVTS